MTHTRTALYVLDGTTAWTVHCSCGWSGSAAARADAIHEQELHVRSEAIRTIVGKAVPVDEGHTGTANAETPASARGLSHARYMEGLHFHVDDAGRHACRRVHTLVPHTMEWTVDQALARLASLLIELGQRSMTLEQAERFTRLLREGNASIRNRRTRHAGE